MDLDAGPSTTTLDRHRSGLGPRLKSEHQFSVEDNVDLPLPNFGEDEFDDEEVEMPEKYKKKPKKKKLLLKKPSLAQGLFKKRRSSYNLQRTDEDGLTEAEREAAKQEKIAAAEQAERDLQARLRSTGASNKKGNTGKRRARADTGSSEKTATSKRSSKTNYSQLTMKSIQSNVTVKSEIEQTLEKAFYNAAGIPKDPLILTIHNRDEFSELKKVAEALNANSSDKEIHVEVIQQPEPPKKSALKKGKKKSPEVTSPKAITIPLSRFESEQRRLAHELKLNHELNRNKPGFNCFTKCFLILCIILTLMMLGAILITVLVDGGLTEFLGLPSDDDTDNGGNAVDVNGTEQLI